MEEDKLKKGSLRGGSRGVSDGESGTEGEEEEEEEEEGDIDEGKGDEEKEGEVESNDEVEEEKDGDNAETGDESGGDEQEDVIRVSISTVMVYKVNCFVTIFFTIDHFKDGMRFFVMSCVPANRCSMQHVAQVFSSSPPPPPPPPLHMHRIRRLARPQTHTLKRLLPLRRAGLTSPI